MAKVSTSAGLRAHKAPHPELEAVSTTSLAQPTLLIARCPGLVQKLNNDSVMQTGLLSCHRNHKWDQAQHHWHTHLKIPATVAVTLVPSVLSATGANTLVVASPWVSGTNGRYLLIKATSSSRLFAFAYSPLQIKYPRKPLVSNNLLPHINHLWLQAATATHRLLSVLVAASALLTRSTFLSSSA